MQAIFSYIEGDVCCEGGHYMSSFEGLTIQSWREAGLWETEETQQSTSRYQPSSPFQPKRNPNISHITVKVCSIARNWNHLLSP